MALNYSHRSIFPSHIGEDSMVSPMRIVNGDGFARTRHGSRGETEERNYGRDRVDRCSSPESATNDLANLLPSDPFGMDIETTFTAITGWLEDLDVNYRGYVRKNDYASSQDDCDCFAQWNLIWKSASKFQSLSRNVQFDKLNMDIPSIPNSLQGDKCIQSSPDNAHLDEKLKMGNVINRCSEERESTRYNFGFEPSSNTGGIVGFGSESTSGSSGQQFREEAEVAESFAKEEVPHEALGFALSYLGVKDLLSVERVCRSLCSAVQGDPLLWRTINIEQPLNERITDDVLLQLATRAQGNLQSLSLVECPRITDDGLRRVLETNPRLTKLCVPGCTRLTIEGILNNLKTFNSDKGVQGIKHLRIGGLYGVTREHFEELKLLLGADNDKLQKPHKPHFYHRDNFYLLSNDDRAIDIEMCPRCEKLRLLYDCTAKSCQVEDNAAQVCRACTLCISRCVQCGRCVNNTEYEENFCLEFICSDCFKQPDMY
ncbi:F-box protein SKIP14-like [Olea europaea var. sylvestris]|uniref:F-box SKIP14-like n=1 Tax=Olea europaea subsp. europaea TaxID=158383 RepID=A0A8S0QVK2_OLEEU|nr:F-box protein SKIP14-like [Olea europaea var. sylvestris]CAA2970078.1 F-box SKIP14-like [Olea europaea subsp. europaea]